MTVTDIKNYLIMLDLERKIHEEDFNSNAVDAYMQLKEKYRNISIADILNYLTELSKEIVK